jgi:hypothetical protein
MTPCAEPKYVRLVLSALTVQAAAWVPGLPLAADDKVLPPPVEAEAPGLGAIAVSQKTSAPYVDSKAVKEHFQEITAEDMDMLRGKKILFASRSTGLNIRRGLWTLAAKDKKYDLLSSYQLYNLFGAKGDLNVIPADVYRENSFVHFLASVWPVTKRIDEVDQLLRQKPHEFGETVDVVIILMNGAVSDDFDAYSAKMDALRRDFPKITFIYTTVNFVSASQVEKNEQIHAFGEKLRARYRGRVPLCDLAAIVSDDFRVGHAYCPEYSKDPAGVHVNLPAGETMMAKGFLLVLRDACKWTSAADLGEPEAAE